MIIYNMRERGPYEYDKFTLNILQLSNAINLAEMNEMIEMNNNKDSLLNLNKTIDNLYSKLIKADKELSISDKVSLEYYKCKEVL